VKHGKVGAFFNRIIQDNEYFSAVRLVLFFDGECGFCQKSVRWIHEFDHKGWIEFAPLQGELAEKFGLGGYAEKGGGSLVVLREQDGEIFTKSDAVAELGKALGGVFCVLAFLFSLLPIRFRNGAYDWVARNRYRLLGNADTCALPDKGLRERMRES
jgi:predicted DCC family thiol-disulfide oxidoreductase YuxK